MRAEGEPPEAVTVSYLRGLLELLRGHNQEALAVFRAAERLARQLPARHFLVAVTRAMIVRAQVRLGETAAAGQALAALDDADRDHGVIRIATAMLRLAQDDPGAAAAALAPVVDGVAPLGRRTWLVEAFTLEAIACDALGDPGAAEAALERALDLAEPDGALLYFLLHLAPELLERHARRRQTAHAALLAEVLGVLAGRGPAPQPGQAPLLIEPPSDSEIRVLRYLPTNLSTPEIAGELCVSANTVRTHVRNLYTKPGAHHRADAVARARALGLLAPSALPR